jgi:glyoxylase-like metal-dependent hydrolase (beta-lactamase superfamily II)
MKRVLKWVGIVVAVLVVAAGGFWFYVFGNNSPVVDGQEFAPGVEIVKDSYANVYFVDAGAGKIVLVDAGHDASGKSVLAALGKRGLTPASVVGILLTHGHPDHTAASKLFPDAKVYAMKSEVALVGDAAKVTNPLDGDSAFDIGELHVEAFATPGHTDGSAVYLARGVLFFGDSAGASKSGEVMKAVPLTSHDSKQNVASLKALAARLQPRAAEIKALAFGHTGTLEGFAPLASFAAKS